MSDEDSNDWRLDNASHLKGLRLQFRRYTRWSETWDHDHCAGCWATLAEFDGPDILHEGYATCDDYERGACAEWVCAQCFNDLKDNLGWTTLPEPPLQPPASSFPEQEAK
ncbi:hypothetical protein [Methylobacterium sp. 17Sr1-1]|uniref:hypothetical protein n=1 Tax=Methylobacterium sp. 17Sr1-1 TaxID=2202826 RepID=UPI000D6ED6D6|nr:hypothetical protein [Methylobacterium sp. 17Sr1-1]AWN53717.1 hypothetical protein DK412_20645 [Methylobacterium sp. 17Sr1-1]